MDGERRVHRGRADVDDAPRRRPRRPPPRHRQVPPSGGTVRPEHTGYRRGRFRGPGLGRFEHRASPSPAPRQPFPGSSGWADCSCSFGTIGRRVLVAARVGADERFAVEGRTARSARRLDHRRRRRRLVVVAIVVVVLAVGRQWLNDAISRPTVTLTPAPSPSIHGGQVMGYRSGPNKVFTPYTRIEILECADPGGQSANLPTSDH